ncbi:hypothetical protein WR25_09084 isoform A [Diploscapter pachys]|uniref:Uncharacterized protein n=1 Tax=Diploscapter pachys TaxID=2018661 RepID=A0A2A2JMY3_9BILA|nr:hypothetical protein WR25_09084 isoform A [Diploscapter pachys]
MGLFKKRQRNVKKTGLARSMKNHKKLMNKLKKQGADGDDVDMQQEDEVEEQEEQQMDAEQGPQKQKPTLKAGKIRRNATPLVKNTDAKAAHSNTVHAQHLSKKKLNKLAKIKRREGKAKMLEQMKMT